jgi:hypothetical protein
MTRDEAIRLLRRPIAFHRIFVTISGSVSAGLMLSQAWYWKDHTDDGWFWKTRHDWWTETALTRFEQEGARRILRDKGFMEESLRGMPAKTYFRVNVDAVLDAISREVSCRRETDQQGGGKLTNKVARKQPTGSRRESDQQDGRLAANKLAGNSPSVLSSTETTSKTTHTARARGRSRFDLATCERFARIIPGLRSPDGYAKTIFRSGDDDDKIAAWLTRQSSSDLTAPGLEGVIARAAAQEGRPVDEVAEEFRLAAQEIQR